MAEETVLAFPSARDRVPVATHVRSTLLTASQKALRQRGQFDRYVELVAAPHRDALLGMIAGVWMPIDVCVAHYDACVALDLAPSDVMAIGGEVEKNVERTVLSVLSRAATEAGATPWLPLSNIGKLWSRVWIGSGIAVYRTGPKDARIEIAGWPLAPNAYMRTAIRGIIPSLVEMFCKKSYVREVPEHLGALTCSFRVAWV